MVPLSAISIPAPELRVKEQIHGIDMTIVPRHNAVAESYNQKDPNRKALHKHHSLVSRFIKTHALPVCAPFKFRSHLS